MLGKRHQHCHRNRKWGLRNYDWLLLGGDRRGDAAEAKAYAGSFLIATAWGRGSSAKSHDGNGNIATALGGALAGAESGNFNLAVSVGNGAVPGPNKATAITRWLSVTQFRGHHRGRWKPRNLPAPEAMLHRIGKATEAGSVCSAMTAWLWRIGQGQPRDHHRRRQSGLRRPKALPWSLEATTPSLLRQVTAMAIVNGADSYAFSGAGNSNVAKVRGRSSTANANEGDGNRAVVLGHNSTATAGGPGSGYHITVIGDDANGSAPGQPAHSSPTEVGRRSAAGVPKAVRH